MRPGPSSLSALRPSTRQRSCRRRVSTDDVMCTAGARRRQFSARRRRQFSARRRRQFRTATASILRTATASIPMASSRADDPAVRLRATVRSVLQDAGDLREVAGEGLGRAGRAHGGRCETARRPGQEGGVARGAQDGPVPPRRLPPRGLPSGAPPRAVTRRKCSGRVLFRCVDNCSRRIHCQTSHRFHEKSVAFSAGLVQDQERASTARRARARRGCRAGRGAALELCPSCHRAAPRP